MGGCSDVHMKKVFGNVAQNHCRLGGSPGSCHSHGSDKFENKGTHQQVWTIGSKKSHRHWNITFGSAIEIVNVFQTRLFFTA